MMFSDLERTYTEGELLLLTRRECDICEEVKDQPTIKEGLESGELTEISDDHPDYETIVRRAALKGVPAIVFVDPSEGFVESS